MPSMKAGQFMWQTNQRRNRHHHHHHQGYQHHHFHLLTLCTLVLDHRSKNVEEESIQSAVENRLHVSVKKNPTNIAPKTILKKSIVKQNVNTTDSLSEDETSSDDQRVAYFAGGSGQSGQQVLGPSKHSTKTNDVSNVFDAARRHGAEEVSPDDNKTAPLNTRREQPFSGTGRSLSGAGTTSNGDKCASSGPPVAAPKEAEVLPIRFFSNGFTVGDGELRRFEDHQEFLSYIRRGEIPPELRNRNNGGRKLEIRLEDHREEEYQSSASTFKAFGGSGHAVGLPGTSNSILSATATNPFINAIPESLNMSRLEKLAEKRLGQSTSFTMIRIRLPDVSKPISIRIDLDRTLADIRRFIIENIPELRSNQFEFLEPPALKVSREDEKRQISDTHFAHSTLAVHRIVQ